ncbi:hypothetical protein HHK36_023979 [Tetracentron sinense]|uniref:Uncharacterized protein n=1 Tax=Tetracentron sinense TaxID=13715 RepID=A0A834YTG6_TETSI|nr:hypothetical protein HHK36_023979 [Tetracentron sinense]
MAEKVSTLVLTVDLECPRCYKKIKKILCKFQDQIFDEKNNRVTIIGPFCPHKMAKKLYCKAGKTISCIEEKVKDPKKPKPNNPPANKPADNPPKAPEQEPEPAPEAPVPAYLLPVYPMPVYPFGVCCRPYYEGYGGGPCYQGCRIPLRLPPWYDGCGRPSPCCDDCERKGNLYHNLDLFHRDLVKSKGESPIEIFVCASFLQMWLWERISGYVLPPLSLVQLAINKGDPVKLFPRALRWSNVKPKKNTKLFHSVDKGFFNFRPYTQTPEGSFPLDFYSPGASFEQVKFSGHVTPPDLNFFAIISDSILVVINDSPFISVTYNPSRFQRQFCFDPGIPLLNVRVYPPPAAGRMYLTSRWPLPEEPSPQLKGQKKTGKRTPKKTTVGGPKRKLAQVSKKTKATSSGEENTKEFLTSSSGEDLDISEKEVEEETEVIYISESEGDDDSSSSTGESDAGKISFALRPREETPRTPVHKGSEMQEESMRPREDSPQHPIHNISRMSAFFEGVPSHPINGVLQNVPELQSGSEVIGQPLCIPMDSLSGIVGENITGLEEDMTMLGSEFGDFKESTQVAHSSSNPPFVTVSSPPFQSSVPVPLPTAPLTAGPQIPPIASSPLVPSSLPPSRPLPVHQSSTSAAVQGSEWSSATPSATAPIGDYKIKLELASFAQLVSYHYSDILDGFLEDAYAIGVEREWLLVRLDELSVTHEFRGRLVSLEQEEERHISTMKMLDDLERDVTDRVKQAEVELKAAQAKLFSLEEEQQILAKNHEELEEEIVKAQDKLAPLKEEGKAMSIFL